MVGGTLLGSDQQELTGSIILVLTWVMIGAGFVYMLNRLTRNMPDDDEEDDEMGLMLGRCPDCKTVLSGETPQELVGDILGHICPPKIEDRLTPEQREEVAKLEKLLYPDGK